jgi:hypothetical protein
VPLPKKQNNFTNGSALFEEKEPMQLDIQNTLTELQNHQHIVHPFTVPEGATRVSLDFEYAPKRTGRYGNLLTLSVFDPHGERGTGHRGQPTQHVTISAADATPGYLPGPIQPGEWRVMINTNLILPEASVQYDLKINISFDPVEGTAPVWKPGSTNRRGPGWYRGDLHGHTVHSDGSWGVDGLVQYARANKLDFVTLTDHNTVSALAEMDSYSADDLLTMGGFEFTTYYGHSLALGVRKLIDWRVRPGERSMTDMLREVEAAGGPGDPVCTGCMWEYADLMPGAARVVEVWNEHWNSGSNNAGSVALWYDWLNQGHKLAATTGTDIHGAPPADRVYAFNVVYAEALTEKAILDGVRRGHNYMSSGPELLFTGTSANGETAMMGDSLSGGPYTLKLDWSGCRVGDRIRWIVDGNAQDEFDAAETGTKSWTLNGKHWSVIEIRDAENNMRALTNPIYTA